MRGVGMSLGIAGFAFSAVAQSHSFVQLIPKRFRGAWGYPGVPCQPDLRAMALRIDATVLRFDEYDGKVQQVIRRGDRAISVVLDFSGEGHRWSEVARLTLTHSGDELVIRPERDSPRYVRCKSARPR
jgi:hypothetical protein